MQHQKMQDQQGAEYRKKCTIKNAVLEKARRKMQDLEYEYEGPCSFCIRNRQKCVTRRRVSEQLANALSMLADLRQSDWAAAARS